MHPSAIEGTKILATTSGGITVRIGKPTTFMNARPVYHVTESGESLVAYVARNGSVVPSDPSLPCEDLYAALDNFLSLIKGS